jgi:hypothetical protein
VLWNEEIIPGPFHTPATASADRRKAAIVKESLRNRLGGHLVSAAIFSIEKWGTTGVGGPIYRGRTTDDPGRVRYSALLISACSSPNSRIGGCGC